MALRERESLPPLRLGPDAFTLKHDAFGFAHDGFGRDAKSLSASAKLADLAYQEPATVKAELAKLGAQGRFFDFNDSQGFIGHTADSIVVGFRGTESKADIREDLKIARVGRDGLDGRFHKGFSDSIDNLMPSMLPHLRELLAEKRRPVLVTGHSLGGAMAALFALETAARGVTKNLSLHTFGSPRAMTSAAAEHFDALLPGQALRVVHKSDAVARVPTMLFGWQHVGDVVYIDRKNQVVPPREANVVHRFVDNIARRVADLKPLAGPIDHLLGGYDRTLTANAQRANPNDWF